LQNQVTIVPDLPINLAHLQHRHLGFNVYMPIHNLDDYVSCNLAGSVTLTSWLIGALLPMDQVDVVGDETLLPFHRFRQSP
jgi:hypothetical protein